MGESSQAARELVLTISPLVSSSCFSCHRRDSSLAANLSSMGGMRVGGVTKCGRLRRGGGEGMWWVVGDGRGLGRRWDIGCACVFAVSGCEVILVLLEWNVRVMGMDLSFSSPVVRLALWCV